MPKTIRATAIPMLRLTPQDEIDLRQLDVELECEILSQYEEFLIRDQRRINTFKWKHARSDADIHAYKERDVEQRGSHQQSPFTTLNSRKMRPAPQQRLVQQSQLPRVLVIGTISGSLDDVMYGMSFHDTPSLHTYWTGHHDRMDESAVVATLEGPTLEDPYRFLGVTWFLRTFPLNIIQRRDFLVLSACHIAQLSNGDRAGIVCGHSIEHRGLPELHDFSVIRGTSSVLKIYRQLDGNRVEVFMIHYLDAKGSIPASRYVRQSITYLMPLAHAADHVGFRRKLAWLVAHRKRDELAAMLTDAIEPQGSGTNEHCEVCDKKIGTLFTRHGTSCKLCYRRVCVRCSVRHDLVVQTTTESTMLKAHDFCVQCLLDASAKSTFQVAQNDVQQRRGRSSSVQSRGEY